MSWDGIESKGENEELIILVQEFSRPSSMDFLAISLKMQLELEQMSQMENQGNCNFPREEHENM